MVANDSDVVDLDDKKEAAIRHHKIEHDDWPEREPLPPKRPPAPELDGELIPEPLRGYVNGVSEGIQQPVEMVATPMMVALGTVLGHTVELELKRSWTVAPNLWGMTVAPSGSAKTRASGAAWRFAETVERRDTARFDENEAGRHTDRLELEGEIEELEGWMSNPEEDVSTTDRDRYEQLRNKLESLKDASPRRYTTSDTTPEALHALLSKNPQGLAWRADELVELFEKFDRDGRESRGSFLTLWSADGTYRVDRVTRDTEPVEDAALSLWGTTQPKVAKSIASEAVGDGLLQRFQAVAYPESDAYAYNVEGHRYAGPSDDDEWEAARLFEQLADVDYDEDNGPRIVRLSEAAADCAWEWIGPVEQEARDVGDDPAVPDQWPPWLRKAPQMLAKVVVILHAIECVQQGKHPADEQVAVEIVRQAIGWSEHWRGHARKLYPPTLTPERRAMYALGERIRTGDVEHEATLRKVAQHDWSGLSRHSSDDHTRTELVREAFERLEPFDWAMLRSESDGPGRPSPRIYLHPDFR